MPTINSMRGEKRQLHSKFKQILDSSSPWARIRFTQDLIPPSTSPLPLNPSNPSVLVLILQEFHVSTFGYFVLSTWCLKLEYSYECGYKYESSGRYRCKCRQNLHNFLFSRLQNATCAARITGLVEHGSISHNTHFLPSLSLGWLQIMHRLSRICINSRQAKHEKYLNMCEGCSANTLPRWRHM